MQDVKTLGGVITDLEAEETPDYLLSVELPTLTYQSLVEFRAAQDLTQDALFMRANMGPGESRVGIIMVGTRNDTTAHPDEAPASDAPTPAPIDEMAAGEEVNEFDETVEFTGVNDETGPLATYVAFSAITGRFPVYRVVR